MTLLIGIVKKNAIIMIDFAVDLQRRQNLHPREAIYQAALLRFRPIMMTTMGAILGALPLAIGLGQGSEMRQPLGISIVGGLLLSQALTLYTTPVVYLYLEPFWQRSAEALEPLVSRRDGRLTRRRFTAGPGRITNHDSVTSHRVGLKAGRPLSNWADFRHSLCRR